MKFNSLFVAGCLICASPVLLADTTEANEQQAENQRFTVEWVEPQKYRDVKHPHQSRKRFREGVLDELSEFMAELSADLPQNTKLSMKVTNLDLAGDILPASFAGVGDSFRDVRVVRQIDIPRMVFSYELVDEKGQVLQSDEVKLKDMNFLDRANFSHRSDYLRYEKRMIKEWFESTFSV